MPQHSINIDQDNNDTIFKHISKPTLVDFWAPLCGPCKALGPVLEELAEDYQDSVIIAKCNIDSSPELAQQGVRRENLGFPVRRKILAKACHIARHATVSFSEIKLLPSSAAETQLWRMPCILQRLRARSISFTVAMSSADCNSLKSS